MYTLKTFSHFFVSSSWFKSLLISPSATQLLPASQGCARARTKTR